MESFFSEKQADDKISTVVEMQREVLSQKVVLLLNLQFKQFSIEKWVPKTKKKLFFRDQDENSIPLKQNQSTVGFISDLPEDKFSNGNDLIVSKTGF